MAKAQVYTGVKEKTRLIHLGLEALIQREAALRLAALGGTAQGAKAGRRRRSADPQKSREKPKRRAQRGLASDAGTC